MVLVPSRTCFVVVNVGETESKEMLLVRSGRLPRVRVYYLKIGLSLRSFASNKHPFRNAYGLKYSVSPETALEKFYQWADDQGLNRFLLDRNNLGSTCLGLS